MQRSTLRVLSVVIALGAVSAGLAGCLDGSFPATTRSTVATPSDQSLPTGSATASSRPSDSPTPSDTPTPTPTESFPPATPLALACDALIPLQALYDLNPIYALAGAVTGGTGPLTMQALADKGTACRVTHTSNGSTAVVTISQPSPEALAADELAASKAATTTYPTGAAVRLYGRSGSLQVFTATHRYTAEGSDDFSPDDLASLIEIAVQAQN